MAIPPQFLKHTKKKPGNAAEDKLDGGKDDAQETSASKKKTGSNKKHSNAKRDALLAQLRGGK